MINLDTHLFLYTLLEVYMNFQYGIMFHIYLRQRDWEWIVALMWEKMNHNKIALPFNF
jgi:hypothetical protein